MESSACLLQIISITLLVNGLLAVSPDCDFSGGSFCNWTPFALGTKWKTNVGPVNFNGYYDTNGVYHQPSNSEYNSYASVTVPFGGITATLESGEMEMAEESTLSFVFQHYSYFKAKLIYEWITYRYNSATTSATLWSGSTSQWEKVNVPLSPDMGRFRLRFEIYMDVVNQTSMITGLKLNGTLLADGQPSKDKCIDNGVNLGSGIMGCRPDLCVNGTGVYSAPDCRSYIRCTGELAVMEHCLGGMVYDPAGRRCDLPEKNRNCEPPNVENAGSGAVGHSKRYTATASLLAGLFCFGLSARRA
ncbi:hypothetical protein BV898_14977 [Hypsibius exemplaris]|uniref:Chitin-binding type-2 domain-containing protein n=1 Tax=Hypsibius exemplaris TaxID=2072580 RepID=A0A9X6RJT6_HYPEX|nr:hypothetical protein BV898_14977 [Hypsibius exemplaris]